MMNLKSVLVAVALGLTPLLASRAQSHRVLLLDLGQEKGGSANHQLLVFEIESNKVLAKAELGDRGTSVAVSPAGDRLAALSVYRVGNQFEQRLNIYRTPDLQLLTSGFVSTAIPRFIYQQGAASDICFAANGQELVIPGPLPAGTTALNCLQLELDDRGYFKPTRKTVAIPRSHGVSFLRVADWPIIQVWSSMTGLLYAVDFDSGEIRNRLALGDNADLAHLDPLQREAADDRTMMRLRHGGFVVTDSGEYGYYVPRQSLDNGHPAQYRKGPGFLRKIDLATHPLALVRQGEQREDDLHPGPAAVSEVAGALFVLELQRSGPTGLVASRRMRVFSTSDLKFHRDVELPFEPTTSQMLLRASHDGKYLYIVDPRQPRLTVIDTATGLELKAIHREIGNYPHILIPLPG